ncbi:MAG: ferredoxin--NADP reductase [Burkholderiales bacterium]
MNTYEALLKGREEVAAGTMAFHLSKPAGFVFKPGQSVTLSLLDPPAEANSAQRIFSLVSAPFEEELTVATRMREGSAFKRALKMLPPDARIKLRGPRGVMTLHEDRARAAVFIAGGIGITPFMSMLRQAAHDRLAQRLFLLYSNRRPEDAPFLAELQGLSQRNDNLRLLARMTDADGFVDEETVRRFVGDAAAPVYYLAGPPAMVNALKVVLRSVGIGEQDVRSEQFYGY